MSSPSEIPVSEVRAELSNVIDDIRITKNRRVVTRNNKRMVAMIPVEDLEWLERLEDEHDLRMSQKALDENDFEDWEVAKKKLAR